MSLGLRPSSAFYDKSILSVIAAVYFVWSALAFYYDKQEQTLGGKEKQIIEQQRKWGWIAQLDTRSGWPIKSAIKERKREREKCGLEAELDTSPFLSHCWVTLGSHLAYWSPHLLLSTWMWHSCRVRLLPAWASSPASLPPLSSSKLFASDLKANYYALVNLDLPHGKSPMFGLNVTKYTELVDWGHGGTLLSPHPTHTMTGIGVCSDFLSIVWEVGPSL